MKNWPALIISRLIVIRVVFQSTSTVNKAQIGVSSGIEPGYYNDGSSSSEISVGGMYIRFQKILRHQVTGGTSPFAGLSPNLILLQSAHLVLVYCHGSASVHLITGHIITVDVMCLFLRSDFLTIYISVLSSFRSNLSCWVRGNVHCFILLLDSFYMGYE